MKKRIKVHSQAEFDTCVKLGNTAIVIGCSVIAWGNSSVVARENSSVEARENSSVVARENSSVEAWGNSSVEAWENSSVVARENSSVEAWGNSSVVARENSSVVAWGNSSVVAWENSSVEAWGNSSVEAWGNSSVEAWGNSSVVARENSSVEAWENSSVVARENSSVEAWGNVFIRLWSALKIKASAHVVIMVHSSAQNIEGGQQIAVAPQPKTGAEYCEFNGIDIKTAPYVVPNVDAAILTALESEKALGLDMSDWHGHACNETNWCETTHCRAGYAICMAGKPGFDLERKYGAEVAGCMIYAVSRPAMPLPDFFADDETALEDIKACAESGEA